MPGSKLTPRRTNSCSRCIDTLRAVTGPPLVSWVTRRMRPTPGRVVPDARTRVVPFGRAAVVPLARSLLALLARARAVPLARTPVVPDARTQRSRLGEPRVVLIPRPATRYFFTSSTVGCASDASPSFARRAELRQEDPRRRQNNKLRSLCPLGAADCVAPFFALTKVASRNVSSHSSRPTSSRAPSTARQTSFQTSCSSHIRNRLVGAAARAGAVRSEPTVHP